MNAPTFLWPWALALLLLAPLLVWLYRRGLEPPAEAAVLHSDLSLLLEASAGRRRWLGHLPAVLYFGALLLALVALARPSLAVPEAHPQAGIILALDISRSMQASDVPPSRFEAAREALRTFVRELPEGARVGLVTFAGYATTAVPLTDEHQRLLDGVEHLYLGYGTAIGEAMLAGVAALPSLEERRQLDEDPSRLATIILLSDGRNRSGIDPLLAVTEVREQQVTVHTVGVGRPGSGPVPDMPWGGRSAGRFDEATLRAIADETGGRFVMVESAEQLQDVYRELSRALVWRFGRDEATALAALAAAVLLGSSLALSELRRRVA